jgi:hypothetical protein
MLGLEWACGTRQIVKPARAEPAGLIQNAHGRGAILTFTTCLLGLTIMKAKFHTS